MLIGRATTPGNSVSWVKHGSRQDAAWLRVVCRRAYQSDIWIVVDEFSYVPHL